MLAIKDMAGLLRAPAAGTLVESAARALRRARAPAHPRHRRRLARDLPRRRRGAGVDAVDGAAAPLAGMTSQPSLSAIVAALAGRRPRPRRSRSTRRSRSSPTGRRSERSTRPTRPACAAPTGRVYRHQIPGGQLSNLRQQADRDRRRRPLRGGRGGLRARQRAARRHHQGHADQQGRRRPRDLRRLGRDRPRRTRTRAGALRPARQRARLPSRRRSASPPDGFPQPFTDAGPQRPPASPRRRRHWTRITLDALEPPGQPRAARARRRSCSPARSSDYLAARDAPRRRLAAADPRLLLRPARGRGATRRPRARACA